MNAAQPTIYLDNNSTTRMDPRVLEGMRPYLEEEFGNAASRTHAYGWRAAEAIERARGQVASLIGCQPREVIFTSGATESDNLAIIGRVIDSRLRSGRPGHVVTSAIEHHAVLDACRALARGRSIAGLDPIELTVLRPDRHGRIGAEQVREALRDDTAVVSIMMANNEIGTLSPVEDIGRVCRERGVPFHTDAAQAVGKVPVDVESQQIDLLSISGHKIYGPKGVGALSVRGRPPRVRLEPILHGGGHERGLRPGTLNVPGIVGLGLACEVARADLEEDARRIRALRDRLHSGITSGLDGVHLNGHPEERLPGTLNLSFEGVEGEALLVALQRLSVSSGSACTSSQPEPSYVLRAIGVSKDLAHASIRFGVGRFNSEEEIEFATGLVVSAVKRLREISSVATG